MTDTFAAWREQATADEATVRVCLDRRLYRQYVEAQDELERARVDVPSQSTLDGDDPLEVQAQTVVDALQALEDAEKAMTFRQMPRRAWRELVAAHPPTKADKEANPRADVSEETFWPAAIAACCIAPDGLTVADATWLRDGDDGWPGLPDLEWTKLTDTVRSLHMEGSQVPKSARATAARLRRALNSTMQPDEASP